METKGMIGNMEKTFKTFKEGYKGISEEMQNCIQCCSTTQLMCEQMMTYCMGKGGDYMSTPMFTSLRACSEMCMTTTEFMMWDSKFTMKMATLCAEICMACAMECDKMPKGDKMMTMMADMCRTCAECCKMMPKNH